jgi:ATP-dependent exoDNAse (exonuclease V) alpha subunit
MAICHLSIKIFSRSKGASAVAKAAYRAAETMRSEYDGSTHDYSRKRGVVHKEILLPEFAPQEYGDRATLWNAVEKSERNINAQLAREIQIALPIELAREQNISLVREYAKQHFVSEGMCADICIHDADCGNPHAHIMLTMRPIAPDGSWGAKSKKEYVLDGNGERAKLDNGRFKTKKICTVDWNESTKAETWRSAWADAANAALKNQNIPVRIDHRSYARQGIELIPAVKMGAAATQMERKGVPTRLGDINREIGFANQQLRQLQARISKLEKWLSAGTGDAGQPALADVISDILMQQGQSGVHRLKAASQMLLFLQENKIMDMAGLEAKANSLYRHNQILRGELKPVERRLKTLGEHIKQAETYLKLKGKARIGSEEILFTAAKRYLDEHLNGRKSIPLKKWKSERVGLEATKEKHYRQYSLLKEETQKIEGIKRGIEKIIRENRTTTQPHRDYERM